MNLTVIENSLSIELPQEYKQLLDQFDDFVYILHNENSEDFPEDDGTPWFFWGKDRLFAEVEMEGSATRPAWQQLASYAEIDKKYRKRTAVPSNDKELDFSHLEKSVSIAEDNGDILYIDTISSNSIWIYMHASGEVKMISESFKEWIENSTIEK
jgi:hypothetical protein